MGAYVGSFNTGTAVAGTVIQVRGVGYQGKGVVFWWTGRTETADAAGSASHFRGFGAAVSTTKRACAFGHSIDAGGSSNADRKVNEDACVGVLTAANAIDGLLDFNAWDADGFDLIVDDQFTASYRIHFLVLPSDTTDADLVWINEPAATGIAGATIAFDPYTGGSPASAAIFFSACQGNTTATASATLAIGAAVSAAQQGVLCNTAADASNSMVTKSYCRSGECWVSVDSGLTVTARAQFSGWSSAPVHGTNQVNLNFVERSSARRIAALVFKGGRYAVTPFTTRTDTTQWSISSLGVGTPVGAMFVSHNNTESVADTFQNPDSVSVGFAASPTQRAAGATFDENGTANAEVTTAVEHDAVYVNLSATDAVEGLMDLVSFDSDGMTLVMDDADPVASFGWALVFGPPATGGTTFTSSLTGTLSLSGAAVAKQTARTVPASLTLAAVGSRETRRPLSAGLSLSPSLAGSRTVTRSLGGSLALAAALARQPARPIAAALGLAGALVKEGRRALTGSLSLSGALTSLKAVVRSLAGSLPLAGSVTRRTDRPAAAALSLAAALSKEPRWTLAGSLGLSAWLTSLKTFVRSLTGSLPLAGVLTRRTDRPAAGSLGLAASLTKQPARPIAAALPLSPSFSASRTAVRALTGTLGLAGGLTKSAGRGLSGALGLAGSVVRQVGRRIAAALGLSGSLTSQGGPAPAEPTQYAELKLLAGGERFVIRVDSE